MEDPSEDWQVKAMAATFINHFLFDVMRNADIEDVAMVFADIQSNMAEVAAQAAGSIEGPLMAKVEKEVGALLNQLMQTRKSEWADRIADDPIPDPSSDGVH